MKQVVKKTIKSTKTVRFEDFQVEFDPQESLESCAVKWTRYVEEDFLKKGRLKSGNSLVFLQLQQLKDPLKPVGSLNYTKINFANQISLIETEPLFLSVRYHQKPRKKRICTLEQPNENVDTRKFQLPELEETKNETNLVNQKIAEDPSKIEIQEQNLSKKPKKNYSFQSFSKDFEENFDLNEIFFLVESRCELPMGKPDLLNCQKEKSPTTNPNPLQTGITDYQIPMRIGSTLSSETKLPDTKMFFGSDNNSKFGESERASPECQEHNKEAMLVVAHHSHVQTIASNQHPTPNMMLGDPVSSFEFNDQSNPHQNYLACGQIPSQELLGADNPQQSMKEIFFNKEIDPKNSLGDSIQQIMPNSITEIVKSKSSEKKSQSPCQEQATLAVAHHSPTSITINLPLNQHCTTNDMMLPDPVSSSDKLIDQNNLHPLQKLISENCLPCGQISSQEFSGADDPQHNIKEIFSDKLNDPKVSLGIDFIQQISESEKENQSICPEQKDVPIVLQSLEMEQQSTNLPTKMTTTETISFDELLTQIIPLDNLKLKKRSQIHAREVRCEFCHALGHFKECCDQIKEVICLRCKKFGHVNCSKPNQLCPNCLTPDECIQQRDCLLLKMCSKKYSFDF